MIQTHRCQYCGDLATEYEDDIYRCDRPKCVAIQFIESITGIVA